MVWLLAAALHIKMRPPRRTCSIPWLLCAVALLLCATGGSAAVPKKRTNKSKMGNLDREYSRIRQQCGSDSAVVQPCIDAQTDVDNCIMK